MTHPEIAGSEAGPPLENSPYWKPFLGADKRRGAPVFPGNFGDTPKGGLDFPHNGLYTKNLLPQKFAATPFVENGKFVLLHTPGLGAVLTISSGTHTRLSQKGALPPRAGGRVFFYSSPHHVCEGPLTHEENFLFARREKIHPPYNLFKEAGRRQPVFFFF